jgi:phosphoesterase RecJ-like protein
MMTNSLSADPYRTELEQAGRFLLQNDDFLVVSHMQPDGDAAGSTFAVAWLLKSLGKSYTLINEGHMPEKYMFMAGDHSIINYSESPPSRTYNCVIAVDCADFARIGAVHACFGPGAQLLNIDHHATNDRFGAINIVRADAAATVEVLFDLAVMMEVNRSESFHICVYSGLLTDTGGFRYANTSPKVMEIASQLLAAGIKGHELAEKLLEKMTYPQVTLLKRCLASLCFAHHNRIGWICVTKDDIDSCSASSEDMDGLVNYARNVEGVQVGLLFKERENGQVKVSLRSSGQADVSRIAQTFGGGGHVRAAGCTVYGSLDEVIERVVKEVSQAL